MKKLMTTAALLVALAISVTSANALTSNQVQEIKKTVLSVPVPEMPAKAAEVVSKAEKKDRQAVAVTAVRAIVMKHRAAAPLVISAISKVAPDLAPVVAVAATEIVKDQATAIAVAARTAAPEQASKINVALNPATTSASPATRSVGVRGLADVGSPSQGEVVISPEPINTTSGGNGNGDFPEGAPAAPTGDPVVIYNTPPQP